MKLKIKTSRDFDLEKPTEEPLLAKPKGGSGTFVFRHGKLWHKHEVNNIEDIDDKRSELAAPAVIGDVPEHRNHATGEIVSTRRRHREILREHNLVEFGNDMIKQKKSMHDKGEVARTIKESIDQLKAGYVNPDEGVMPEGYVEEVTDLDDIEVDVETVQHGDYIRQSSSKE